MISICLILCISFWIVSIDTIDISLVNITLKLDIKWHIWKISGIVDFFKFISDEWLIKWMCIDPEVDKFFIRDLNDKWYEI